MSHLIVQKIPWQVFRCCGWCWFLPFKCRRPTHSRAQFHSHIHTRYICPLCSHRYYVILTLLRCIISHSHVPNSRVFNFSFACVVSRFIQYRHCDGYERHDSCPKDIRAPSSATNQLNNDNSVRTGDLVILRKNHSKSKSKTKKSSVKCNHPPQMCKMSNHTFQHNILILVRSLSYIQWHVDFFSVRWVT